MKIAGEGHEQDRYGSEEWKGATSCYEGGNEVEQQPVAGRCLLAATFLETFKYVPGDFRSCIYHR